MKPPPYTLRTRPIYGGADNKIFQVCVAGKVIAERLSFIDDDEARDIVRRHTNPPAEASRVDKIASGGYVWRTGSEE